MPDQSDRKAVFTAKLEEQNAKKVAVLSLPKEVAAYIAMRRARDTGGFNFTNYVVRKILQDMHKEGLIDGNFV